MTEIKLPAEFQSGNCVPVDRATIARQRMAEILAEAIEADRMTQKPPNEPFAIVIDRIDGEGPSMAYWNGQNYQFSDGDCFNREGDTLDGYTAEFLTDYQLEKRLFADRQARSEPIGEVLAFPMGDKPKTHSTLAGLKDPQPVGMLVYAAPQNQQIHEGYKLVPIELLNFIAAKEHHLPVEDRHCLWVMLEAAPKVKP